jgi:hypothetical protein
MMQELIERIAATAGIEPEVAQNSISTILSTLHNAAPEQAQSLFEQVPGLAHLVQGDNRVQSLAGEGGGGLMGAVGSLMGQQGGGMMQLFAKLSENGLSVEQMQTVGTELLAYAKEHLGQEGLDALVADVPALKQLV